MRALCAEQVRALHELQFTIKSLQASIQVLQGQVQMLQAAEGCTAVPCKVPVPSCENHTCPSYKSTPKPTPKAVVNFSDL